MDFDLNYAKVAVRDADGFIRVQPEPYGSSDNPGTLPNYEAFLHGGIVFRPKDPTGGVGCEILVDRHGGDGRVQIGKDPRWMSALPDFGDGGTALYATTELNGVKVTPFVGFFGEGGAAPEGTFRISVPTAAGTSTIEVNATTGDVTITHPNGTIAAVKATGVELGAAGGVALVRYPELQAAWAGLMSAASSAGITVPPLTGAATTKVTGT